MKILIAGAGYVGGAWLKRRVEAGDEVLGIVRSKSSELKVPSSQSGEVGDRELWGHLGRDFDVVLYCASTRGGGIEDYRHIHETGLRNALEHATRCSARFFYTSSTSVFSQNHGGWVEESDADPSSEKAGVLLLAEQDVQEAGGTVLRLSGIYGPERMYHLRRLQGDAPRLPGDGTRYMNMIHREDILGALDFLLEQADISGEVFNVTDDEPVTLLDFYSWLCPKLGQPVPPRGGEEVGMARGLTSKRVSNKKLRALGWELKYPTYREGYAALLAQGG